MTVAIRRRPRSLTEFLRDVAISKAAQRHYRDRAVALNELADEMTAAGLPLPARITRYRAHIAASAADAEYFDPEPR